MGELAVSAAQKQLGGNNSGIEKQLQNQNTQNGSRSFENVLQQNNGQTAPNAQIQVGNQVNAGNQINKVSDPKLESMRVDLMNRYQNLPEGVPKVTSIFPEYLDTKTRMSAFRNILDQAVSSGGNNPQATNVQGRFSQVEDEWLKLENVMRSDKELSQGEMLGLQARLYQVSQHIDVLSKVVDQMSSGVKTILNTNV